MVFDTLAQIAVMLCLAAQAFIASKYWVTWPMFSSNLLGYTGSDARRAKPLALMLGTFNMFLFVGMAHPFIALGLPFLGIEAATAETLQVYALACMLVMGVLAFGTEHHPREPSVTRRWVFLVQAVLPAVALGLMIYAAFAGEAPAAE